MAGLLRDLDDAPPFGDQEETKECRRSYGRKRVRPAAFAAGAKMRRLQFRQSSSSQGSSFHAGNTSAASSGMPLFSLHFRRSETSGGSRRTEQVWPVFVAFEVSE